MSKPSSSHSRTFSQNVSVCPVNVSTGPERIVRRTARPESLRGIWPRNSFGNRPHWLRAVVQSMK